jgi:predicted N-acetyltransferase YhbS
MGVNTVNFRSAVSADKPLVHDMQLRALPDYTYTYYAGNIEQPNLLNMVGVMDGTVVAFATVLTKAFKPDGPAMWQRLSPYLGFMVVEPSLQGRHIGTALMEKVIREVAALKFGPRLFLECQAELCTWYERFGFRSMVAFDLEREFGMSPRGPVMAMQLPAET